MDEEDAVVLGMLLGFALAFAMWFAIRLTRYFFSRRGKTCDAQEDQLDEAKQVRSQAKSADIGRVLVDLGYVREDELADDKPDGRSG
ncbi:MAG: hypothetical protein H0W86_11720 [Armatimonadetes bacterium]|nr:hypothetical protein [Armatimonadota bacterium]